MPYGESDLIATFFTLSDGKMSAMVRGARRSQKRFGGGLEPIHELFITLEDRGRDLGLLKEARIAKARSGITESLEAMDAAGRALRWVRHVCPPRTPEPETWVRLSQLFERLDEKTLSHAPLVAFGLGLLAHAGYGLDLERCVRCGRPCPPSRPAMIDAAGGGLVCSACGGARRTLSAALREAAGHLTNGVVVDVTDEDARTLMVIAEEAMAAHADFDSTR